MKKQILLFLLAFLPLLAHAFTGEVEINGIKYFIKTGAQIAEVREKYGGYSGDVIIPSTVEYGGVTCNVTLIADKAFYDCYYLTSVTIPNSVTKIGDRAFYFCGSLNSITIGNSVTSIGVYAFEGCTSLTSITIPNSVTSIGEFAFEGCTYLTSITIPNSVTSIGEGALVAGFGLTSIKVESGNTIYDSRGNCNAIIKTSTNELIAGCKNTVIPNSVTRIGKWAFAGCYNLTSITIPNGVTSIGDNAFYGCENLTTVIIPNSVTKIGDIDGYTFTKCPDLSHVYCYAINVPSTINSNIFTNSYPQYATLHVPEESMAAYKNSSPWNQFGYYVPLESSGISFMQAEKTSAIDNYTLDGQPIDQPRRGVNIVRMSDGTVKKVVVK